MQGAMRILSSLNNDIWSFNPQSRIIAVARSGLALSQVLTLLLTPAPYLYSVPILGQPPTGQCTRRTYRYSALRASSRMKLCKS